MRWLRLLTLLVLIVFLALPGILLLPARAIAAEASLPTTSYQGATVPDFAQITFSSFPAIQQAGAIQVSGEAIGLLGYNPSRTWEAGASLGEVFMLGDTQSVFGLQSFNLSTLAQLSGLNLSQLSLSNFPLLAQQTIASLVNAIPTLGNFQLGQVQPLADLVNQNLTQLPLDTVNLKDWGNNLFATPLSVVASSDILGALSLSNLPLEHYSFTQIPELDQVPLSNFKNWQTAVLDDVPGLTQVPFAQFPLNPFQILGVVALHDVTYGGDQAHQESWQTPTQFSITGSDRVGFHHNCQQARGCDYLELNAPGYSGFGGANDPSGLHGARWIRGGKDGGEQMVSGGYGVLGQLNGGMEPTGRLPFGPAFKVVLTETDESTGTGQFGLYFRVCIRDLFVDLGCTPYFIGPIPFLSTKEKGLIFVGMADGNGGMQELPPEMLPPEAQEIIDQYGGGQSGQRTSSSGVLGKLCGTHYQGVNFEALATAFSGIEGDYGSPGSFVCNADGCGRGLGRYQYMSYRDDVRAMLRRKPGGSSFLAKVDSGAAIASSEILKYFPPESQNQVFESDQKRNIDQAKREIDPRTGKPFANYRLIERIGQIHFGGPGAGIDGGISDTHGRLTLLTYGQELAQNYKKAQQQVANKCSQTNAVGSTTGKPTGKYGNPVGNAPITSPFGERVHPIYGTRRFHAGIDFGVSAGTPVKAADGGRIIEVVSSCRGENNDCGGGYGNYVVIDHGNGRRTLYGHLQTNSIPWSQGQSVGKGTTIGRVGSTGRSTGPHLHFETQVNGQPVNPAQYGFNW
ncbi:MAG: M23 family metallopeptidase [Leptolyngbyaceae cyanobacterium bins.59]|nr:M23 family metallopeptidase [Leptolyngbyaceae cyanobacterium bins.59]